MNEKDREDYHKEIDVIREFENRNDIGRDSTLMQLSVGLLAIIAAFGDSLIQSNKTLAFIAVVFLGLTVLILITGFITTKEMLKAIREKMKNNVSEGKTFYDGYTDNVWQKVNTFINTAAFITFLLSISFFVTLLIIYIGGLNVK
jgi:hypothetical protein